MNSTLPLALTFLTKLPWPWRGPADAAALARSMFWFPWVGAVLGLGYWGAWAALQKILPAPAAAALLLAYLSPYARAEGGLGQAMTLGVSPRVLTGASLSAGGLSLL
ncbi:MAG TPA: adenosylcobinamide-GDP ribazoletransferase, partial [Desulfobaccales bacterium]|nr:adenosylcobinamide-GDP ribazoletransferase [Desulfobaccales bacterium]